MSELEPVRGLLQSRFEEGLIVTALDFSSSTGARKNRSGR